jgi:hypothetical protein
MRVRSAEIFGDEKAIDRLIATGLFGEDRLTLDLLGCRRYPPPLTVTRAGEGPDVLVVENSDAYWVALEALRNIDSGIGRVAFGSGRGFVQSVYALAEQPDSIEQLWYWGDLDPDGIAIPAHAAKVATTIGLPPLAPARRLWDAMAAQTGTDTGLVNWIGSDESWLGPELWSETEPIRAAHARVAQERLSPNVVRNALAAGEVQLPGGPPLG